jgi:hypothetical protein
VRFLVSLISSSSSSCHRLAGFEVAARDVHLDREAEQELREVVVEERRDLHALVLALLGHPVRKGTQNVFTILKFLVRLLESLATEEHLPSKEKRQKEHWYSPPIVRRPLRNFASMSPKTERPSSSPDIRLGGQPSTPV